VASKPDKVASQLTTLDELLRPPGPPERIHGWQYTQMSIARFYGGLTYQGAAYTIAVNEPGQPLVRDDVLAREAKAEKAAAKAARTAADQRNTQAQGDLI
jgi:hypothetical protein